MTTTAARAGDALLDHALRASEAVLGAAREGLWERVEALAPARDAAIREVLSSANPQHPGGLDTARAARLVALDAEIVQLALSGREASGDRIRKVRRAGRAHRAYTR